MRSGKTNADPVAVGNRAAEAWAEADARAVVIAAASDDGQAALRGAAVAFTDAGKGDKARAVADVAMLAGAVAQMGALAGRVAQQSATLAEEMRRGLELEGLSIPAVVEMLQTTPAGGGWTALAMLVARLARPIEERHLIAVTDRAESITLVRQPARVTVATLSELEAVAVDGEPFVTKGPDAGLLAHYRARPRAAQRGLPFAGPRRMDEHLIGSPVVRALQSFPLIGDERSPIRGDTLRVAALGYASTGAMLIDEPTGALLFGANTAANRKRFWEASRVYHHLELTDSKTGRYVTLGHAPADGRMVSLGAPFWWRGQGEGHRWSLTGRLLGPRFDNNRGSGGAAGFQSGLTRTVAGLESALSYSRSAGKGKHGRTPYLLRQVRKGGAGPDTFIPWRALLSLAGEPVPADAKSESVWGRRYRRRVAALIAAGYLIPAPGGVAPAGDTVEIVRVVDGRGHGHVAGVRIRASARFCAAHADNIPTRLSATRLFDGSG